MRSNVLSAGPTIEPVTLIEAKAHCRVEISDDDTMISSFITAARQCVEDLTSRIMVNQTWKLYLDEFPEGNIIELPLVPLSSVSSIKYTDTDGTQKEWSNTEYFHDADSEPPRIVLKEDYDWPDPDAGLKEAKGIEIIYVVGYGATAASVPECLKLAIKMLVAHFYENREAIQFQNLSELPMGAQYLISPFRLWARGLPG